MKTVYRFAMLLAILLAVFSFAHALTFTIGGDATQTSRYLPLYTMYNYNYTQQIYTQAQINTAGSIKKIRFFHQSGGSLDNSKDWVIYMGHSSRTAFTSNTSWEPVSNLTQVFDGDLLPYFPADGQWMEIPLDTPFEYNNVDNLIIAIDENTESYSPAVTWGAFASGSNSGIYYYDDSNNPDPSSPPTAKGRNANIARIQLVFPDTVAPMAPILVSPENNAQLMNGQSLNWTLPAGSADISGYKVYIDDELVSGNHAFNSYILSDLSAGPHTWYVTAFNDIGSSPASETRAFDILSGVIIGDGNVNQNLPVQPYYIFSYSQSIYLQSEINISDRRIEKIFYYWNGAGAGTYSSDWTVYMGHTDRTEFDSTSDWIPVDELTQVFSGDAAIPSTAGWVEIILQTPFEYNNIDNLVIAVDENNDDWDGNSQFFYSTNVSTNRSLLFFDDDINPDPASPPSTGGYLRTAIPNIKMLLGDLPGAPALSYSPISLDFGTVSNGELQGPLNVTVSNSGNGTLHLSADDVSLIGPHAAEFSFESTNLPAALTPNQTAIIPVYVTGTTQGDITATLRIVYDDTNYDVALSADVLPAGLVFIGDGTVNRNLPVNPYYDYSYSQSIYLQPEINISNKRLTKISYYWNGLGAGDYSGGWTVYMGHTDRATFSSTFDWIPFNQLTQVYSGNIDLPATAGWVEIILDTPFLYNNVDNLVIAVDENEDDSDGSRQFFLNTNTSTNRSIVYFADGDNPNPATPPGAIVTRSAFPNIKMQFSELPSTPEFYYAPNSLDFGTVTLGVLQGPLNVTITNIGSGTLNLSADDVSIIGPQATSFSFDGTNLPAALSSGQTALIPVYVNGNIEGQITATLRMVYDSVNYDVNLSAEVLPAGTVFVGEGIYSQRQPFGVVWGFEHSAALYAEDQINYNGMIYKLGWECDRTSETQIPYKIWAKTTTETSIAAESWADFSADMTLLKEGVHTFNTLGWHIFELDTPFEYTQGNLIIVTESAFGGSGGTSGHSFLYSEEDHGSHAYWYSDGSINENQLGSLNSNRPNIMLGFLANTGNISGTVTGADNQALSGVNIQLNNGLYNTSTNALGHYQFNFVPEGSYALSFSKHGYQTHSQTVVLQADDELVIDHSMQPLPQVSVSGTILAYDTGAGIAGASIVLTGYEDYSANTDATGDFTIVNVYGNQNYNFNISAPGYTSTNGIINVTTTNHDMAEITLTEVAYAPARVSAAVNDQDTSVMLEWLAPDPSAMDLLESFEDPNFPPQGWMRTITNNNPANALGVYPTWCRTNQISISGDPVIPSNGSYQAGLFWDYNHQDEWLISPSFNCPPNGYLSFDSYVFLGSDSGDHYYVKVSTDNGDNWIELWDASAQTGGWNRYASPITVNLHPYSGNLIKLAFHALDSPDNDGLWYPWFIDNIYIGNANSRVDFDLDDFIQVSTSDNAAKSIENMPLRAMSRHKEEGGNRNEPWLPYSYEIRNSPKNQRALTGYKVYRFPSGNEQNETSWILLTPEIITDLDFEDQAWQSLPNGDYTWAVKAVYTNGITSIASLSNSLNKFVETGMIAGVVRRENTTAIAGATVSVAGYTATTNTAGAYTLIVPVGSYDVTAEADGFNAQTVENVAVSFGNTTTVNFILHPVSSDDPIMPVVATALNGNFPNPFNPETTIRYSIKTPGAVKLEVYNIKGQLVKTLVNEDQASGHYKVVFNSHDNKGKAIASGVYLLKLSAPGYQKTSKMILMQ